MIALEHRFPDLLPFEQIFDGPVLVIAPHADDEVIAAGGSLCLAAERGLAVRVLHLSDGSRGDPEGRFDDLVELRQQESNRALSELGLGPAVELGFADGTLAQSLDAVAAGLAVHLREFAPRVVVSLSPFEAHADHRVAAEALRRALRATMIAPRVLFAGVNSPVPANVLLDVTAVLPAKDAAMSCYETQIVYNDIRTKVRALDASRTVNVDLAGVLACEAFLRVAADEVEAVFVAAERLDALASGGLR